MALVTASLRRNLSRLELAIVVIVITILAGLFMQRFDRVAGIAEQAAFSTFVNELRTRVRLFNMAALGGAGADAIVALAGSNPVDLLRAPAAPSEARDRGPLGAEWLSGPSGAMPSSYLGEIDGIDRKTLKKGRWAFDIVTRALVYRMEYPEAFAREARDSDLMRFVLTTDFADQNGDGRLDPAIDRVLGLRLETLN